MPTRTDWDSQTLVQILAKVNELDTRDYGPTIAQWERVKYNHELVLREETFENNERKMRQAQTILRDIYYDVSKEAFIISSVAVSTPTFQKLRHEPFIKMLKLEHPRILASRCAKRLQRIAPLLQPSKTIVAADLREQWHRSANEQSSNPLPSQDAGRWSKDEEGIDYGNIKSPVARDIFSSMSDRESFREILENVVNYDDVDDETRAAWESSTIGVSADSFAKSGLTNQPLDTGTATVSKPLGAPTSHFQPALGEHQLGVGVPSSSETE